MNFNNVNINLNDPRRSIAYNIASRRNEKVYNEKGGFHWAPTSKTILQSNSSILSSRNQKSFSEFDLEFFLTLSRELNFIPVSPNQKDNGDRLTAIILRYFALAGLQSELVIPVDTHSWKTEGIIKRSDCEKVHQFMVANKLFKITGDFNAHRTTRYIPSPEIAEKINVLTMMYDLYIDDSSTIKSKNSSVTIIKDESYNNDIALVTRLDEKLNSSEITFFGSPLQYCKTRISTPEEDGNTGFVNYSDLQGKRLFNVFTNMSREARKSLRMNGEKLVGFDICQSQMQWIQFDRKLSEFNREPAFKVAAQFGDKDVTKDTVKAIISAALYTDSEAEGKSAGWSTWRNDVNKSYKNFELVWNEIMKNDKRYFFNGKQYSHRIQNLESDFLRIVLNVADEQDLTVLPIHDAFYTAESEIDKLDRVMKISQSRIFDILVKWNIGFEKVGLLKYKEA